MVALCVAVPYWVVANSRAEDRADARAEAHADVRDCDARATSGAELKAATLASVEHAEDSARLMDSIADILETVNPASQPIAEIRAEVNRYVVSVAGFRKVVEQYTPTTFEECMQRAANDDGDG